MGDQNAVDVAQCCHEGILRSGGCLPRSRKLVFGEPVPRHRALEGVYIDDHLVIGIVGTQELEKPEAGEDKELVDASRRRYAELDLPISKSKKFSFEPMFTAWGTETISADGKCGAPRVRRSQLLILSLLVLASPEVSKELLQGLLGSFIYPLSHRRETMAVLERAFRRVADLPKGKITKIPHSIRDESLMAALVLPVAESYIRSPVCSRIQCSGSTPVGAGCVSATVSQELSEGLYGHCKHKGRYIRLDWGPVEWMLREWRDRELPRDMRDSLACASWHVDKQVCFKASSHVNLQEARAVRMVLEGAAVNAERERIVCRIDSRVVLSALVKRHFIHRAP